MTLSFLARSVRSERVKAILFGVVALLVAMPLSAQQQVGFPPAQSPYRDLEFKQEISPFGGWVSASTDAAGAGATTSGAALSVCRRARAAAEVP